MRIEPLAPRHAPAVQRLAGDPRITETTRMPEPYPPGGAARFIAEVQEARQEGEAYHFAVIAGAGLVGACGLNEIHDGQAELGYWIGVPFWGRGYATAAARLVAAYGFDTLGLDRLTAHTLVRNPASGRVLEKLGFRATGEAENPFSKWAPEDRIRRYSLERAAWRG